MKNIFMEMTVKKTYKICLLEIKCYIEYLVQLFGVFICIALWHLLFHNNTKLQKIKELYILFVLSLFIMLIVFTYIH